MDNMARSALMSFMDGLSGYNQIKMALKEMTKTTFTTEWGIYCYTVMLFWPQECWGKLSKDGYDLVT